MGSRYDKSVLRSCKIVDNHFTAHGQTIVAVINLQFAVINLQFAVIDYQNVSLLWNNLQPHKINRYTIST